MGRRGVLASVLQAFFCAIADGVALVGYPATPGESDADRDLFDAQAAFLVRRRAALKACQTCHLNGEDAPVVIFKERDDGIGMRAMSVLLDMAVAAKNGMNFGGLIPASTPCRFDNCRTLLPAIFGASAKDMYVDLQEVSDLGTRFGDLQDLENYGSHTEPEGKILFTNEWLGNGCMGTGFIGSDRYMTSPFLAALRSQATWMGAPGAPVMFAEKRPRIAMHVRRGDTYPSDRKRYLPDEAYLKVVEEVRKQLPNADVHVFSSTQGGQWRPRHFDVYRSKDMEVHLDQSVAEDWTYMTQADVLILGPSTFGFVPGHLNDKCVIYQPFCWEPLGRWINGQDPSRESFRDGLASCIASIGLAALPAPT